MKTLYFDNYDSFSFNLIDYLRRCNLEVTVWNEEVQENELIHLSRFDALVVGPGPNRPGDSKILMGLLEQWLFLKRPLLGVCLGHQALGCLLGMNLVKAKRPMHGKQTLGEHTNEGVFNAIPSPMPIARYHSLVLIGENMDTVDVLMRDEQQQVMAFKHKEFPWWGIQFHPESILTPDGITLLKNWVRLSNESLK